MKKNNVLTKALNFKEAHEREIGMGVQIACTVLTGICGIVAGFKIKENVEEAKREIADLDEEFGVDENGLEELKKHPDEYKEYQDKKNEKVMTAVEKSVLPVLAVTAAMGGAVASEIKGYKDASTIITGLSTAYTLTKTELINTKEATKKLFGEDKVKEIKDAVAAKKVEENPIAKDTKVVVTGNGDYMCYDPISGRYFRSNVEKIRSAVNTFNERLMTEYYISLNEFYNLLGLPNVKTGYILGFCIDDGMIDMHFSYQGGDNEEPVCVLDYEISSAYTKRNGRFGN